MFLSEARNPCCRSFFLAEAWTVREVSLHCLFFAPLGHRNHCLVTPCLILRPLGRHNHCVVPKHFLLFPSLGPNNHCVVSRHFCIFAPLLVATTILQFHIISYLVLFARRSRSFVLMHFLLPPWSPQHLRCFNTFSLFRSPSPVVTAIAYLHYTMFRRPWSPQPLRPI